MTDNNRKPPPKCKFNKHGEVVLTLSIDDAQYFRAVVGNTNGSEGYGAWDVLDGVCKTLPGYYKLGKTSGPFDTKPENRI